jgi:hypothetical protein
MARTHAGPVDSIVFTKPYFFWRRSNERDPSSARCHCRRQDLPGARSREHWSAGFYAPIEPPVSPCIKGPRPRIGPAWAAKSTDRPLSFNTRRRVCQQSLAVLFRAGPASPPRPLQPVADWNSDAPTGRLGGFRRRGAASVTVGLPLAARDLPPMGAQPAFIHRLTAAVDLTQGSPIWPDPQSWGVRRLAFKSRRPERSRQRVDT